ncbi:MAG: protein kinase domain-containing protein [Bacteroidales bacterium]
MFCAYCGAETQTGEARCRQCGQPLPHLTAERDAATVGAPPSGSVEAGTMDPTTSVTRLTPPSSDIVGRAFGTRYPIIRELGRGGMGVVYQAWDDELGLAVALKTILPDSGEDPESARERERRFKRELVLARQVTHKHVVRIHDLGEINGVKYLTMPFIQGETLSAHMRRAGHLPVARALRYAKQIVSGLVAAHEKGIVHRDLKPANIMIDGDDEIVILDFGLARSVSGITMATAAGTIVGTLDYMAPEQLSGSQVDQRADIYAVGLIVHEMLVGKRRSCESAIGELLQRAQVAPPSLRALDPQIPEAIDAIVARCVRPNPTERYQTSAELLADLDALDAEGYPPVARPPAARPRKWLVPALAAACVVAVAAVVALFLSGGHGAAPPVAHAPVSVLIPDFDNRAGDKAFEGALEQTLSLAIEGASFITAYPRTDALRVLEKIRPGEALTEANARLVAQREGIHVVLPGVIGRQGSQYDIRLSVMDPTGQVRGRPVEETAGTKDGVIKAVVSLSGQVRQALGDTASESAMRAAAETFTTVSLDAMREYAAGQNLLLLRKDKEAIEHFRRAVAYDKDFGRAYAGWAVAAHTLGHGDEANEQWAKATRLLDRMTEREQLRTQGTYFLGVTEDFDNAVSTYEKLIKLYPADTAGHGNLALAYFYLRQFPNAFSEGQKAIDLQKNSIRFRSNYALYAMYAGRFKEAETQAKALIKDAPSSYIVFLPLAVVQAARNDLAAARDTYAAMARTDESGQSTAALGFADLALYEGNPTRARTILERGIEDDTRAKNTAGLISKYAALGEAALLLGDKAAAVRAADTLVTLGHGHRSFVPAASIYIATGKIAEAQRLASALANQVPPQARAYGKMIEGQIALQQGHNVEAVVTFKDAVKLADLWLARYALGIAYVQSGDYVTGQAELVQQCAKRQGEATAVFLDDLPTIRLLAPLHYWIGRAKEGQSEKDAAATEYRAFLTWRPEGSRDPLAIDARKRLMQ